MAMRGRGGRGDPSRPLRMNVGRVYEQFKPMSEWRQEDNYDTLLVYLPGFQKEYIKVTTEETNIVRVRGERLIAENKWSRFQEDYRVPENCEMRGIRARFEGGILTITMPRKIITTPETTTTTTARPTPKPEEKPMRRTKQEEEALPKRKQDSKEQVKSSNAALEPEKIPEKPQSTRLEPTPASSSRPAKQEPIKMVEEPNKTDDKFTFGSLPTSVPKKDKHDAVEKPNTAGKTDFDDGKGKEAALKEAMKRDSEDRKRQSNDPGDVNGVGYRMEEHTKVAMRRMNLNEDRKLLMNVGVGVLVIVAIGVHVSYTLGLIGKGK